MCVIGKLKSIEFLYEILYLLNLLMLLAMVKFVGAVD